MTTGASYSQTSGFYEDYYYFDYGDEYMYPGYKFERPVYLYLWEILVFITFLQNLLILSVFLRRKMRNPTNTILSALAISDSLTGLVTLPTYIMVFQRYDPFQDYGNNFLDYFGESYHERNGTYFTDYSLREEIFFDRSNNRSMDLNVTRKNLLQNTPGPNLMNNGTEMEPSTIFLSATIAPVDGYILSKSLCRGFMISKYFLSKSFHTISIFLTLFLELQRYVAMAYPYRYETCFNRVKIVNIYCISVFALCPLLHAFHLGREKAIGGMCQWALSGVGCGKDCIYLWIAFIVRHFLPCVILLVITSLFIHQLRKGEKNFRRTDSNPSQYSRRVHENRRISFIVTAVVVVRLIPEIPYSIFLLFNSIDITVNMGQEIDLETNRILHMTFELCLIVSFLSNFYIYLVVHKSFRKRLYRTFIEPFCKQLNVSLRFHEVKSSDSSRNVSMKSIDPVRKQFEEFEMKTVHPAKCSDKLII